MAASKAGKPMSKTEILNSLAESTELTKKEVASVLDQLLAQRCQRPVPHRLGQGQSPQEVAEVIS